MLTRRACRRRFGVRHPVPDRGGHPGPAQSHAEGATEAVQLAPGVWSPVQGSAAIVITRVLDGYCASVEEFERQYRAGLKYPGTCW
jgi:hypothetical protein